MLTIYFDKVIDSDRLNMNTNNTNHYSLQLY